MSGGMTKNVLMDTGAVETSTADMSVVEADLANIQTDLETADESVLADWVGTAKTAYLGATDYVQKQVDELEKQLNGVHGEVTVARMDKTEIDGISAEAAATKNGGGN